MQLLKPTWINHDGDKAIFSVDIHPDGSRFATGGQGQDSSGRVVIWNISPVVSEKAEQDEKVPKLLCQLDQHLGCVNSVRWSQSGDLLASAGDDKVIIIWQQSRYGGGTVFGSSVVNVESWRIVNTLRGHKGDILDVAWSPQDIWLASASIDNTVIIWNATKWPEQVRVLKGHTGLVKGVTWDPIGRYLASQADDKSMRIWRTSNWTTEQKIVEPFVKCGGTTTILRPSWSPDGQYLVSAHAMNNGGPTAQIIERDGWNIDKDFVGHRKAITCVRFNPNILIKKDGKQSKPQYCCVAIGSRDRSISIWFTSLKRPLVVIHDIFEDSVLDLAWSKCGQYLMAVSKDGSLAFIHFNQDEIGRPSTVEQTNIALMKLYGNTALNATSAASTIIENPELLRLQEEERAQQEKNLQKRNTEEKRVVTPTGPTNKQIEMRTADGRRRITPMFIPPPAEGDTNSKSFEASFSSSRQEKSKIIIEKVDGIVEPNVSSPTKNSSKSSGSPDQLPPTSLTSAVAAPDLDGVPAGLSARIEAPLDAAGSEKLPATPTPAAISSVKRKSEEPHFLGKRKRGRGRPPLHSYEKHDSLAPPSRPPSPTHGGPTLPTSQAVVGATTPPTAPSRHCLPLASIPRLSRIQIPGASSVDGGIPVLVVENDWRVAEKVAVGVGGTLPSLTRISRSDSGGSTWVTYLTSQVRAACVASAGAAIACLDASLHLLAVENGDYLLPPIQLTGMPSQLFVQDEFLLVLTTDASLSIWDFNKRKRLMKESVRHLVENRSSVKCVQIVGEGEGSMPVVILKTGEAYSWYKELESWVQLGESAGVRRYINAEFSMLTPFNASAMLNPLSGILVQSGSYSGSSRLNFSSVGGSVKQGLTESFIKRMLTSSKHLNSSVDFKFWYKRLAKFYISEAMEKELRKMFDELLGPAHSGSITSEQVWNSKIMGMNKRELLEEFLKDILLAENSIQFQRLHSEYHDLLKGLTVDAI